MSVTLVEKLPFALHGSPQDRHALRLTLANEAARFGEWGAHPRFSLIAATDGVSTDELAAFWQACLLQSWPHWEVVLIGRPSVAALQASPERLKQLSAAPGLSPAALLNVAAGTAQGDMLVLVDPRAILHPQLLGIVARKVLDDPRLELVYCNEVALDESASHILSFLAKPAFDRASLARLNYVRRPVFLARSLAATTSERPLLRDDVGSLAEQDLLLSLARRSDLRVCHLPIFGCYVPQGPSEAPSETLWPNPELQDAALRMLTRDLTSSATVVVDGVRRFGDDASFVVAHRPSANQRLGVIIPFHNGWSLTEKALASLEQQEGTLKVRAVLVDHDSDETTQRQLDEWLAAPRRHHYELLRYSGAFNFAKINNQAAAQLLASCDFLLLMNNDVELLSPDALSAMAGELERFAELAFVGIKLWYPNRQDLQHGGIKVTTRAEGVGFPHARHMLTAREFVATSRTVSAVSFACAMCRSQTWRELGGLEENFFPNGYGDVDICLRAMAQGKRNFYLSHIEAIHHESRTRKNHSEEVEEVFLHERHGALLADCLVRELCFDPHLGARQGAEAWFAMHLRYRMADAINDGLKRLVGPWHRPLRRLASRLFSRTAS